MMYFGLMQRHNGETFSCVNAVLKELPELRKCFRKANLATLNLSQIIPASQTTVREEIIWHYQKLTVSTVLHSKIFILSQDTWLLILCIDTHSIAMTDIHQFVLDVVILAWHHVWFICGVLFSLWLNLDGTKSGAPQVSSKTIDVKGDGTSPRSPRYQGMLPLPG